MSGIFILFSSAALSGSITLLYVRNRVQHATFDAFREVPKLFYSLAASVDQIKMEALQHLKHTYDNLEDGYLGFAPNRTDKKKAMSYIQASVQHD